MKETDRQPEEMPACPMSDKVDAFIANDLSDRETADFERHLAGCEECLSVVIGMRRVRNSFQTLSFLRRVQSRPGPVPVTAALLQALTVAGERARLAGDAAAARLLEWRQRLVGNLNAISDRLGRAAVSTEELKEIGCAWVQQISAASRPVPGLVRDSSGPMAAPAEESPAKGGVQFRVEPVPASNDIEVVARGLPAEADQPVVLLMPVAAPDDVRRAVLRRVSEHEWIARFENIPAGEYMVAIEPLSRMR